MISFLSYIQPQKPKDAKVLIPQPLFRTSYYWCVYCTKLAPISKTDDFARSACVVASMRTKFWQNYFLGRKGFAKTSAHLFLNSDVANGKGEVWEGIFHLLHCFVLANWGRACNDMLISLHD